MIPYRDPLGWTSYIYGALAHSSHIEYSEDHEVTGEGSVRRGLRRMGMAPEAVAGCRVLDVGTGLYGLGFTRLGAIVEHHDISVHTIEALNRYAEEKSYTNLHSFHTNLVSDPLPTEQFDIVYLSGVSPALENPARALTNVSQALKLGGYLYFDIYRSGRWRWFVVDVLRQIIDRSLLFDVLSRFTEFCALGELRSFDLRQVELLIDDLFVEYLQLFHPEDVQEGSDKLGLEVIYPASSMDKFDSGDLVNHSLHFAHVFNTIVFKKMRATDASFMPPRLVRGRSQLEELSSMSGSYSDVLGMSADFILAHQAGRFSREERISHVVNLFRMAHSCFTDDPYLVIGHKENADQTSTEGNEDILSRRHALWCTFLSNILDISNPLPSAKMQSLGYELVRFLEKAD